MNLLLDAHVYLWVYGEKEKLSETALESLSDPTNDLYLSVASIWELQIKVQNRKLNLEESLVEMLDDDARINDLRILSISRPHAANIINLLLHHKDPFDRMLISQAMVEDMTIVTADKRFSDYDVKVLW